MLSYLSIVKIIAETVGLIQMSVIIKKLFYNVIRSNIKWDVIISLSLEYTHADFKMSLHVRVRIKIISWKFDSLNPKDSRVIHP